MVFVARVLWRRDDSGNPRHPLGERPAQQQTLGPADPVPLHFLQRIGPVDRVEVVEEAFGEGGVAGCACGRFEAKLVGDLPGIEFIAIDKKQGLAAVWRELRKIRGADAVEALPDIVKPLHQAADSNNWAAFIAAAEGQDVALWTETSADMVERLELEFGDFDAIPHNRLLPCLNAWGEPDVRRTLGVYVSGVKVKTRLHKWRIEWKRGEAAPHVPAFGTKLEIVLSRTFEELTAERRKHRQEVEETIHNAKRGAFAFQGQSPPLDLWQ